MEMFIDSYDWVMVPNVYGMSQFSDGGIFSTKPYISSSNYVKKMSNFKSGPWCEIWDVLFWKFIKDNERFFRKQYRLAKITRNLDKMSEEKKDSKKCSGKKNIMFAYGFIQLGSSFVSAVALAAIAFGFCSVKKESKLFNKCVAEIIEDGGTNSEAVRYCNGGN